MWNQFVWWACIGLEGLLLFRAARTRLFKRFPLFYFYVFCVLASDIFSLAIYDHYSRLYFSFYWATEFLLAALSYGVIVEIYGLSLKNYPGVARFLRILLLLIFLAVAAKVSVNLFGNSEISLPRAIADLERSLRQMQALLLGCLLALFMYYKIPANRNLRGLILGYALFIAADVIALTFIAHPTTGFAVLMRIFEPVIYAISLLIWSVTLWSSSPRLVLGGALGIEQDYEHLARETRTMLLRARTHLMRATRL